MAKARHLLALDPVKGEGVGNANGNSGHGLFIMSEICKKLNGSFTLLSKNDCIRNFPHTKQQLKTYLKGTVLSIRINTEYINEYKSYQEIIKTACKRGREAAQSIKNI